MDGAEFVEESEIDVVAVIPAYLRDSPASMLFR
jgi:hypothetical protein